MANARGINGLLCCSAFIFTTLTLLSAAAAQTPNYTSSSLDSIIASRAVRTLLRSHSGLLYLVTLPADMSGIKTSVVRVRRASLWTRGLQSPTFRIPPRTITVPRVKRLAVVYEDLGNRSAAYYVSGRYSLASPVFGCLAYDASNGTVFGEIREVELRPMNGDRISVVFPTMNSTTMRCVEFRKNGSVHMTETMLNVCSVESTGHFAIVVPSEAAPPEGRRRRGWWWGLVVMVCAGGVVGLVLVGLVGAGILKVARRRRREEMEVHAEREILHLFRPLKTRIKTNKNLIYHLFLSLYHFGH